MTSQRESLYFKRDRAVRIFHLDVENQYFEATPNSVIIQTHNLDKIDLIEMRKIGLELTEVEEGDKNGFYTHWEETK